MGILQPALDLTGEITGSNEAARAGVRAGEIQAGMAQAGISEQRRQFDKLLELMSPYLGAGTQALGQQKALLGLSGQEEQAQAIQALEQSPLFSSLVSQGENAMRQNASATGGLRGGNFQAALAQFRPNLLSQVIEQQYGRLGGLTGAGFGAAGNAGQGAMNLGGNVANLLQQQGAAQAGGALAAGGTRQAQFGNLMRVGGLAAGFM